MRAPEFLSLILAADLQREFGFSCLLISHDLAVVRYPCDRIAVMSQGEIVEAGTRDEVFRAPRHPCTKNLLAAMVPGA